MTLLKRPVNVFLIHTHHDREFVHKLYSRLVKDGVNAWLDTERLLPGQDWRNEIRRAILMSDLAVICLSKQFIQHQGFCQEEIKIALEKTNLLPNGEVFIVPTRLEECDAPESLNRLQRVDLFEAGGYKRLIRALRVHAGID